MKHLVTVIICAWIPLSTFAQTSDSIFTLNIIASPIEGGTVSGSGIYLAGESATVTASANDGYTFHSWTANGIIVATNPEYTFIITSNTTLFAHFTESPNTYTIATLVTPENSGTTSGQGIYNEGDTVHLTAIPNAGYTFHSWTVNGIVVSNDANYSFVANANILLQAVFTMTTRVEDPEDAFGVDLYPNPSAGIVNMSMNDGLNLKIYNPAGQLITANVVSSGYHQVELVNPGIYIFHFTNQEGDSVSKKVMVQN